MFRKPDWDDPQSQFIAYTLGATGEDEVDLHIILNMSDLACEAELPHMGDGVWHRAMDTSLDSPDDITPPGVKIPVVGPHYNVQGRSVVVLMLSA